MARASRPSAPPIEKLGFEYRPSEDLFLDERGLVASRPEDSENPKNWSLRRRCYLTFVAVLLAVNATFASSAPSGALNGISRDLHVSVEAANLVTSPFLLGFCAGPLLWAPLSEFFGRRPIFLTAFTTCFALNFLCAFTPNFAGPLVGRFLTGIMASCAVSNAPGVLANIRGPVGRGNAMILFVVGTFIGPALGPVVSSFLELKKTWRWSFYVLICFSGLTELISFTLPETLGSIILLKKARRHRRREKNSSHEPVAPVELTDRRLSAIFRKALLRPWQLLVDPTSFFIAVYHSVVYTLSYMLFSIYHIVFQHERGWNAGVGELPLFGIVVGGGLAEVILHLFSLRDKKRALAGYHATPEDRLPAAMLGWMLFVLTIFWFAWTAEYNSVHWIVPTLAGTFLAMAILLLFASFINYLVDSYVDLAASAVTANTVLRSACAATGPLFTQHMFDTLGVGDGGSLIGGIAVLLCPIPFMFYRFGKDIRQRSKFLDLENRQNS